MDGDAGTLEAQGGDMRSARRRPASVRLVLAAGMLAVAAVSTWLAVGEIESRRRLRYDLAELGDIRYGLLNADRWVAIIVPILSAKIDVFDVKSVNQENLRRSVERILEGLIDDVKETIRSNNMKDGVAGRFRQSFVDKFVNFEDFRRQVPKYAQGVIARLETPETKATLRQYLTGVVAKAAGATGGAVDLTRYSAVLERYGCKDGAACREALRARVREADARTRYYYIPALLASAMAFVLVWAGGLSRTKAAIVILLALCMILLIGGLTTPMIEIEAKISQLTFRLLGEPVTFADQVVYFQTKSIWEVVTLMFSAGGFWTPFVGVLVLLFSVILPSAKLAASAIYCYDVRGLRDNRVIRFLVLKSSKWSMADVMVIALFMAYIGFDRVLTNSLAGLAQAGGGVDVVTTSGTSLQPGYFLFIGFCIASLLVSAVLDRPVKT